MDDDTRLSPASINYLVSIVADGTATPEEARELLVEFVRRSSTNQQIDRRLIEHLSICISAFLDGRKLLDPAPRVGRDRPFGVPITSMEKAFGLRRVGPGGPRTDPDTLAEVAMEVLDRRLRGESFQDAAVAVADDRKARGAPVSTESQVRAAWTRHQADGFWMLRLSKAKGVETSPTWTPLEIKRLTQIFRGEPWFTPPGVDAKARMDAILAEADRPGTDNSDMAERVAAVIKKFDDAGTPENSRNK